MNSQRITVLELIGSAIGAILFIAFLYFIVLLLGTYDYWVWGELWIQNKL